jgi:hypothetical protein
MMRPAGIVLTALVLAVAAAWAQERPADTPPAGAKKALDTKEATKPASPKEDELELKLKKLLQEGGKLEKELKDAAKGHSGGAGEDKTKDLLARVAKNMEAAEDRLKNQDPGDQTQKIQDDIVKDLTELLKQQQKQQQQQQSSSSSSSSQSKGSKGSKSAQNQKGSKSQGNPKTGKNQGQKDNTQAKKDSSSGNSQKKDGQDKKPGEASASKTGGGGKDSQGKGGATADLFRDVWGHLPEAKRLEMDAYSRERLMPEYEELLRQYYRAIAESHRRKGE